MLIPDRIYAINPCIMDIKDANGNERRALTIGKRYAVIEDWEDEFAVIDDEGEPHRFPKADFDNYFSKNAPETEYVGGKKPHLKPELALDVIAGLITELPNDSELGKAVRNMFTK